MSLAALREQNKLKDSIIYAKKEGNVPPHIAKKIKEDVYCDFIAPIGHKTLSKYCKNY